MPLSVRDMIIRSLTRVIDAPHSEAGDKRVEARRVMYRDALRYVEEQSPECEHIVRAANAMSISQFGTPNVMRLSAFVRDGKLADAAIILAAAKEN